MGVASIISRSTLLSPFNSSPYVECNEVYTSSSLSVFSYPSLSPSVSSLDGGSGCGSSSDSRSGAGLGGNGGASSFVSSPTGSGGLVFFFTPLEAPLLCLDFFGFLGGRGVDFPLVRVLVWREDVGLIFEVVCLRSVAWVWVLILVLILVLEVRCFHLFHEF
eukprot:TRINITY_DN4661_c0_g1_i2.p1 TRINITY_DN4661_c0_g1~~TRINITY_DN4661_c0_g1_i2.p1  ORF type:complete len:162 (+),score=22.89 TRINITY_DN4661_c0_g1_i2:226-711(+)